MAGKWIENPGSTVRIKAPSTVRILITVFETCRLELQAKVRKSGHSTPDQQQDMLLKRSQLQEKVASFQKEAAKCLTLSSRDGDDFWDDTQQQKYTAV